MKGADLDAVRRRMLRISEERIIFCFLVNWKSGSDLPTCHEPHVTEDRCDLLTGKHTIFVSNLSSSCGRPSTEHKANAV